MLRTSTNRLINNIMKPRYYSGLPIRDVKTVNKIWKYYKFGFVASSVLFTIGLYYGDETKIFYPFSSFVNCAFGGIIGGVFWPIVVPYFFAGELDNIYLKLTRR